MDNQEADYSTPDLQREQANVLALELLQHLDGLSIANVQDVLRRAEIFSRALIFLDCQSEEFRKAVEGWHRAVERRAAGEPVL